MHPSDIKAAIEKRNHSPNSLAQQHGYSRAAFSYAIRKPHPRVEKIVSIFPGISLQAFSRQAATRRRETDQERSSNAEGKVFTR